MDTMWQPDCDKDAVWEFRPDGIHPMSMHEFEEVERIPNCEVQILRCTKCGKLSVGWRRMGYEVDDDE